jgi:LysR family glycine cleavage system transcriptional activator
MHGAMPPLSALRAFEAAARHLSLTKAAAELNVTAGALSHQIRGLEDFIGQKLFERRVRSIALTPAGKLLYPGLQTGFAQIRAAVAGLRAAGPDRVLVISTPPGLTAKWLAPRLYRFAAAHPDLDTRISSSMAFANFVEDGVDVAVRNLRPDQTDDPALVHERLIDISFAPVCSPKLIAQYGALDAAAALARVPLIHDDTLAGRPDVPTWDDWLAAAGMAGVDVARGLRFNSADHALDAVLEGAGMLLAHGILAYDDLRSGRLVLPFKHVLPSQRAYYFVCPKATEKHPSVQAFRAWLRDEVTRLDFASVGLA